MGRIREYARRGSITKVSKQLPEEHDGGGDHNAQREALCQPLGGLASLLGKAECHRGAGGKSAQRPVTATPCRAPSNCIST